MRVISCKLSNSKVNLLTAVAQERGESKATLLRELVLDFLAQNSKGKPMKVEGEPRLVEFTDIVDRDAFEGLNKEVREVAKQWLRRSKEPEKS